jgi:hypothetical protein
VAAGMLDHLPGRFGLSRERLDRQMATHPRLRSAS